MSIENSRIIDFISGQEVPVTPEEIQAVQVFSKQLVEDYGYPKEHIHTRPQYHVKRRPSDEAKEWPVDIAVFSTENHIEDDLQIIVECKKKTRKDGRRQLEIYLELSKARFGVWFNGNQRLFIIKHYKAGKVFFSEIPNIPNYGQRVEDIGKFKRSDLRKPAHLQLIFHTIRNYLAGNAIGVRRDEALAQQMINIIFCKIYDEKFTKPDDQVSFHTGVEEAPEDVSTRINAIFEKVKGKYKDVISENDEISLDDRSLNYVVGELQNYSLIDADRDAIGEAFEVFITGALKGGQGQFFTPRNVVQLMVKLLDPRPDSLLLDPACGSGGFLVESLKYKWDLIREEGKNLGWNESAIKDEMTATAINSIRGIEVDEFLSKVAKAYMAIIGDGKGGIFCEDSLLKSEEWNQKTRQSIVMNRFDIVVTNPPFGKEIKVVGEETLGQYKLAHHWKINGNVFEMLNKVRSEMQPQVLFIERCLQFLTDGGKLGIILPETFFHAPNYKYILSFMKKHNFQWLVDLPHNTFRPHNNAKTIAVIIQKNVPQQEFINMAVAEQMGHDHNGGPIYRWDYTTKRVDRTKLWDDISEIIKEFDNSEKKFTFNVPHTRAEETGIYVPRYYWNKRDDEVNKIAATSNMTLVSIQQLISENILTTFDGHGSPPAENKGRGEMPYIRVKDIVNWDIYKDPTALIPREVYDKYVTDRKKLKVLDVVFVRRGSYRIGSVAMISPFDSDVMLTRELLVLRVRNTSNMYDITPYYLMYLISSYIVQMQMYNKVLIETTLPNIADRWKELKLPINNDVQIRKDISDKIKSIFNSKWEAIEQIKEMKEELGNITT